MARTVYLGTGVDYAALGVSKHSVITAIFLAEMSLLVLAFNDVVYLHTIIALRCEKEPAKIVKADGQDGILQRRRLPSPWLATKQL